MSCVTGLSASKYALYILNKQLHNYVSIAWDIYILNKNTNTNKKDSIVTIIDLLSTIQFDDITNNSISVYPHIIEDLFRFIVIYYTCDWNNNEYTSGIETQCTSNNTSTTSTTATSTSSIREIWKFCMRVMNSDNSMSGYDRYSIVLFNMLPYISNNCCYYASHVPLDPLYTNTNTNNINNNTNNINVVESQSQLQSQYRLCNEMYLFTLEYFTILQQLLSICCATNTNINHKKWYLLYLTEGGIDCCIQAYNSLLIDPICVANINTTNTTTTSTTESDLQLQPVFYNHWTDVTTREVLIHSIDSLVVTCI